MPNDDTQAQVQNPKNAAKLIYIASHAKYDMVFVLIHKQYFK